MGFSGFLGLLRISRGFSGISGKLYRNFPRFLAIFKGFPGDLWGFLANITGIFLDFPGFLADFRAKFSIFSVIRRLRDRTYSNLLGKDISYFDKNQSGEVVSRLSSDCQVIGQSATVNLNDGFRAVIQFTISTFMIMKMAPPELLAVSAGGIVAIMGIRNFYDAF